jgi:hypothetical protein
MFSILYTISILMVALVSASEDWTRQNGALPPKHIAGATDPDDHHDLPPFKVD